MAKDRTKIVVQAKCWKKNVGVKAVQEAVLALYAGVGEPIDDEIADLMCATWDRVMKEISVDGPAV